MDNISSFVSKHDRSTLTDNKELSSAPTLLSGAAACIKKAEGRKILKKKLKDASDQNQSLETNITTKNQEINELKKSVASLNEIINSVPIEEIRNNSSIATAKIVELSKRNRQLRIELEAAKNRNSKLEMRIKKIETDAKSGPPTKKESQVEIKQKMTANSTDGLQTKINVLQQKLFESRNMSTELRNQLKLAQKCLQQEIGEDFNLNILASAGAQSSWRGRAQQIIGLQLKVTELNEKLLQAKESAVSCSSCSQQDIGGGDEFCRPAIRKQEILHRAKLEQLEKEITSLKEQLDEQKTRMSALKVRNKTLMDDVMKYKRQASSLEEQTDFKGYSIAQLNEKINIQNYQYENRIKAINKEMEAVVKQRKDSELQQEQFKIKIQNLHDVLAGKDEYIAELNSTIDKLENDLKAICGDYLFSCRELRKEEFIAILDSLESEKNDLLVHSKVANERLEQERNKCERLVEQLTKHKLRISRLEGKLRDSEKDQDIQVERKKRSQRMSDYANSLASASSLSSFVFENTSTIFGEASCLLENDDDEDLKLKLEKLQNHLELATEKITILEEKIAHISKEKEEDAKMFEQIVKNSKNILLDTILDHHSDSHDTLSSNVF